MQAPEFQTLQTDCRRVILPSDKKVVIAVACLQADIL